MRHLTVERHDLGGFEGLQNAVKGTHFDIVQLGRGKLGGCISYIGVGDLTLSVGAFSAGVCAQRSSSDDKILIGMLLDSAHHVTQWSFDMRPADIVVIPPFADHHAVHCGASSYAAIRLDPHDLPTMFGGDPWLSDGENWREKNLHRADAEVRLIAAQGLPLLVGYLARQKGMLSAGATEFWKRTIIECMTVAIGKSLPPDDGGHLPSAVKLVRLVEEYLRTIGDRPQHISEICSRLGLSRRSLHRAFHEILGIGPVTFLRQKRLCAVHSILKRSSPMTTTVAEVAIEHGFVELGRFSRYYRMMFGETPSHTLGSPTRNMTLRTGAEATQTTSERNRWRDAGRLQ